MSVYDGVSCKFKACPRRVVGSSITGKGHVCAGHNLEEWGHSLRRYDPELASGLLSDARRDLEVAQWDGAQLSLGLEAAGAASA